MRKTIIASDGFSPDLTTTGPAWLDLPRLASVEISSEDARYPVEQALGGTGAERLPGIYSGTSGWRAELLGPQTLALRFDQPQTVRRVLLHFREAEQERSQEFTLHATMADGRTQEIVRQQWSFSPGGSTEEQEDYSVNLEQVTTLTLWIDPDRGRDRYRATLEAFRVEG
jgi:hypothetical protein